MLAHLRRSLLDVMSLRVRLGLVLVLAASLPLILAVAAIGSAAESSAIDDALSDQKLAAANIARAVTQLDAAYRGAITSIASRGGFALLTPEQQRTALESLMLTNVFGFSTYDATGHAIVRSDNRALQDLPPPFVSALRAASGASVGTDRAPG